MCKNFKNKSKKFFFKFNAIIILAIIGSIIDLLFQHNSIVIIWVNSYLLIVKNFLNSTLFGEEISVLVSTCVTISSITFSFFTFSKGILKSKPNEIILNDEICQMLNIDIIYNKYIFIAIFIQIFSNIFHFYTLFYSMIAYQIISFAICINNYTTIIDSKKFSNRVFKEIDDIKKESIEKYYKLISLYMQIKVNFGEQHTKNTDPIYKDFVDYITKNSNTDVKTCYKDQNKAIKKLMSFISNTDIKHKILLHLFQSISTNNTYIASCGISSSVNSDTILFVILLINLLDTESKEIYKSLYNCSNEFAFITIILYFEYLRSIQKFKYKDYQNNLYLFCIDKLKISLCNTKFENLFEIFSSVEFCWFAESEKTVEVYFFGVVLNKLKNSLEKLKKLIESEKQEIIKSNLHFRDIDLFNIIDVIKENN